VHRLGGKIMTTATLEAVPTLEKLPATLPRSGAIDLELEQGVLIFRVAPAVQERIETLLDKQRAAALAPGEEEELQQYEDVDDYLSYLNRVIRNLAQFQPEDLRRAA
jgi:hypothetical protein